MLNRFWLGLRSLVFGRRLDRETRDEMADHLARTVERLMAQGMARDEAERAARREFGNLNVLHEEARDARGGRSLESLAADVRFGLRQFARRPVSTITMIVVLALGIGFNAALFVLISSLINGVPPGYTPDESLVRIRGLERNASRSYTIGREFSYPEYAEYAAQTSLFAAVAAWTSSDVALDVGPDQENLHSGAATYVTPAYFQVLGVRPIAGAGLPVAARDADDSPELLAVISHVVWERFYFRANDAIGRTLKVNGVPVTIVGVAPRRFNGARSGGSQVRLWLPLSARSVVQRTPVPLGPGPNTAIFGLVAKVQPGVDVSHTQPTVQAIAARTAHEMTPGEANVVLSTDVVPLLADNYFPPSGEVQDRRRQLVGQLIPMLIPFLVLAITCTTVSALQAGLAIGRRREMAVRLALGAPRRRLVRQLVTESVMLALGAAALGLFVVWILLRTFESAVPDLQVAIDRRSFAFTGGLAIASGILFGLSPALHATRLTVSDVLKDAAGQVVSSRSRLPASLVVAQIALTQPALLAMGALFLQMVESVREMPRAVQADRILDARFSTNPRYGPMDSRREQTLATLRTRFAALPGVVAVVPQENTDDYVEVAVHDSDRVPGIELSSALSVRAHAAPAGYFPLMSLPIVLGRDFDPAGADPANAIVVGAGLARRLWGDADPIGRRLASVSAFQPRPGVFTVIGVVGDARAGGSAEDDSRIFVPAVRVTGHFLIRTQGPAQPIVPVIRSIANSEAPELSLVSARTLAAIEDGQRSNFMKAIAATGGSGAVALLLSAIGLYAVVALAVGQRSREIGIRAALGADRGRILGMFLRRGLRLSLAGVSVGIALSIVALRLLLALGGEEPPSGTAAVAAVVTVVVTGVTLLATWIPARRATRIDPLEVLRAE
jgi:putative ABC transport system permease protein